MRVVDILFVAQAIGPALRKVGIGNQEHHSQGFDFLRAMAGVIAATELARDFVDSRRSKPASVIV